MSKLKRLEDFFFAGMPNGWASGNNGMPSPYIPNWSIIVYRDDQKFPGLTLLDEWGDDPDSGKPSGRTLIMEEQMPSWAMWSGGEQYLPQDLPVLQAALMENYSKGIFMGGRGPAKFKQDGLIYTNGHTGTFARFQGNEFIIQPGMLLSEAKRGEHDYWGGSLVYLQ